jgi:DNA-binding winged helix-turn-helix (wHTH) protein
MEQPMTKDLTSQDKLFRKEESRQLFDLINAGESASIIGMSGTGKSNLFDHICHPDTQEIYLQKDIDPPIILRVNFHYAPDFSERSLYSVILEQLEDLSVDQVEQFGVSTDTLAEIAQYHDALIEAKGDLLKVQRQFKRAIRLLMLGSKRKLIFLFDQFDEIYQEAESRFFANLRGLRQAFKYRIAYFTFTRDLLPNLAPSDPDREEFYELLSPNVIGLRPYTYTDASRLMQRIGDRHGYELSVELKDCLVTLSGGHGGLLRASFLAAARDNIKLENQIGMVKNLLKIPSVQLECEKIWRSLNGREQKLIHRLVNGLEPTSADKELVYYLQIKGILPGKKPLQLFAPLFGIYAEQKDALWEQPLFFDSQSRQVWVLGEQKPSLTKQEYRLFQLLYERAGELVSKDELIDAGWPDAMGGVTDEALTAALARLRRKIEPDSKEPRFFENIRNQGYILRVS